MAKSSYYTGPPSHMAAFGTPPSGVIGRDHPREIVRVERDYSAGELCLFHPSFPLELEGRIKPAAFTEMINDVNVLLISAHRPLLTWLDNALAILTFYLSPLLLGTHHARTMAKLDALIQRLNTEQLNPCGLNLLPPRRTGFLFLEIEYY